MVNTESSKNMDAADQVGVLFEDDDRSRNGAWKRHRSPIDGSVYVSWRCVCGCFGLSGHYGHATFPMPTACDLCGRGIRLIDKAGNVFDWGRKPGRLERARRFMQRIWRAVVVRLSARWW